MRIHASMPHWNIRFYGDPNSHDFVFVDKVYVDSLIYYICNVLLTPDISVFVIFTLELMA